MLLRPVRALPDRLVGAVSVLGVDDFAFRRGHRYGTILIDMDTHRPVDVLDDRLADTFAAWLEGHPGVTVVCRDRGGAYAPLDVARVKKTVAAHHGCIRTAYAPTAEPAVEPDADAAAGDAAAVDRREDSAIVVRTKQRYAAVQALKAQDKGIKAIRRELGLAKETVRKFYRAANVDELLVTARAGRSSILDPFKPFLHDEWNAGRTNVSALYREIVEQGYRGSYATVCDYLGPLRTQTTPPPAPTVPKVRRITSWLLSHPDHLDTDDEVELNRSEPPAPNSTPPQPWSPHSRRSSPNSAERTSTRG